MTFNLIALATAVLAGVLAAATGAAVAGRRELGAKTLVTSALVLIAVPGVVAIVARAQGDLQFFGLLHVLYLVLTIGLPIAALTLLLWSRRSRLPRRRFITGLLVVGMVPAAVGIYASHIEPFWLRVDRVSIELEGVAQPFRIGVLSDLQTPVIGDYETSAVTRLIAEAPDVVLIPGDWWQTRNGRLDPETAVGFRELLVRLDDAIEHVVAVGGDNDRAYRLREITEGTNVLVLDNEIAEITVDGQSVWIAGLGNDEDADLEWRDTLDGLAEAPDNAVRLVLAHRPDAVLEVDAEDRVDLVVSGHTHGGQVAVPLFGPLLTFTEVPRSVAAGGLSSVDGTSIYVSTGVGRERRQAPQVRFLVRPSIGVLDIS